MGCSNNSDINFDRRVAAHAVELAVGQHPQQPRLRFGRHIANFIEEKCATIGLLEAAFAAL